jgi:hypothetical protein
MSRRYLLGASARAHFTIDFGQRPGSRTARTLNQTVRVCKGCNNGWMSRLEQSAQPLLTQLADGSSVTLDGDAQHVLALWLAKDAIVHEPLATPQHRISTPAQRSAVARGEVPDGWDVAIAGYEGTGPTFEHHFGPIASWPDDPQRSLARLTTHTTRMECFVGQIVVHSLNERPELDGLLGGNGYAISLPSPGPVHWPPTIPLNEEWLGIVAGLNIPPGGRDSPK